MLTSYHNHTTWSDGASTVEEMIESARRASIDELGISDHFALSPDGGENRWSLKPDELGPYVAQVTEAGAKAGSLSIRLGLEVDFFPETIESVRRLLDPYPFDFLVGSVHFANGFPVDYDQQPWKEMSASSRNDIWRHYWRSLRAAAASGLFDFMAHFDLPKKFGLYPTVDLTAEALAVLDAIAQTGTAIEINTSGWDMPVREAYPALSYLKEARRRGIPLVINADAHRAEAVVNHFERARSLAREAGYTELVSFRRRRCFSYPLSP